jgi:hypothetical protein
MVVYTIPGIEGDTEMEIDIRMMQPQAKVLEECQAATRGARVKEPSLLKPLEVVRPCQPL